MNKQAVVPTSDVKLLEVPNECSGKLGEVGSQLAALGAEGWVIANVIQAHAARPALVILIRPRGAMTLDVELPEQSNIAGVTIAPASGGNGRTPMVGPFRR